MTTEHGGKPAAHSAQLSTDAWRQVRIEAATTLDLYGAQNRGFLEVTVVNNSRQLLSPEGELGLSYKALDKRGRVLPVKGVCTPLEGIVAAGTRRTQKVAVLVPQENLAAVAAVRVGLVREGQHGIEQLNPEHPATVQVSSRQNLSATDALLGAASQIWPQRKANGLRWPYGAMMVSERHKLFYIPVAKCACTSLKSMMVRLAGVEKPEIAMELGVHLVTDRFSTGVQLKDKPIELAREILASDQYFKFSVLRDPFERLVSAYLEKFVYNRHNHRNLIHTRPVIRAVQGSEEIDLDQGISFDQFLEYILQQDPYELDTHWRPQHLYFRGVPHISKIFRLENIDELENHLRQHHQIDVKLGHKNKTAKSDFQLPRAHSLPAAEFDQMDAINPESFLHTSHAPAIRRYYQEDFEFYAGACPARAGES